MTSSLKRKQTQIKRNEMSCIKAQEIIHDEAPWIPLVHSIPMLAASNDLKGYQPHPTGSEALTDVYFE